MPDKAATTQLDEAFALADTILNDRLDKLALQFEDSNPQFFTAYTNARIIVDSTGGQGGATPPTPPPPPNP